MKNLIDSVIEVMTRDLLLLEDSENPPDYLYPQNIHRKLMYYSGYFFGTEWRSNPYGELGLKVDIFTGEGNVPDEWYGPNLDLYNKEYKVRKKIHEWSNRTVYNYVMSLRSAGLDLKQLKFGYACVDDKLVKTAFFADGVYLPDDLSLIDEMDRKVFDPMAYSLGIKPSWYIGCSVTNESLEQGIKTGKHPLCFLAGEMQNRHFEHVNSINGGLFLD